MISRFDLNIRRLGLRTPPSGWWIAKAGVWQRVAVLFFAAEEDGDPGAHTQPVPMTITSGRMNLMKSWMVSPASHVAATAVDVQLDRIVADALQQDHLR